MLQDLNCPTLQQRRLRARLIFFYKIIHNLIHEVLWSIRGSYSAIWSIRLTNVKWHSDPWPTVTSQPIRLSTNFMTLHRTWPSLIMSGFHGAFATGVACPSGHLVPSHHCGTCLCSKWDLLVLQLLRPDSSNLPCLYSTFHLEYPLVLSWFCLVAIYPTDLLHPQDSRTSHSNPRGFQQIHTSKDTYKFLFYPSTIVQWNMLPAHLVSIDKLDVFKEQVTIPVLQAMCH